MYMIDAIDEYAIGHLKGKKLVSTTKEGLKLDQDRRWE